jgi:hypothetical protein
MKPVLSSVTVATRPVRMTMLFDFFKKKAVVTKVDEKFKPLTGSAVSLLHAYDAEYLTGRLKLLISFIYRTRDNTFLKVSQRNSMQSSLKTSPTRKPRTAKNSTLERKLKPLLSGCLLKRRRAT